jgi:adenylate cyclase
MRAMPTEIERKFLLRDDRWRTSIARSESMRQGYLANGPVSVRVRTVGEQRAWLNIKSGGFVASRAEFDYEIPVEDAQALIALCSGPLVEKVRHHVEYQGFIWEIDEFAGDNDGLIVAEIELDDERQAFPQPPWIGREVTDLARYYNVCLVGHPYRAWSEAERRGE